MENKTLMDSLDNLCKLSETEGKKIHAQIKRMKAFHINFYLFDMINNKQS